MRSSIGVIKHQAALMEACCTRGTLVSCSISRVESPCSKGSGAHAGSFHRVMLLLLQLLLLLLQLLLLLLLLLRSQAE